MQRKGEPGGADQDPEAVLDRLYGTPPPDFVARRAELATAAKAAGRAQDASRIRAARRPTLAAWAANLLRRSRPEESERFLELGQALREAYRSLDADGIRELNEQRRSVVSAMSGQAAALAQENGHRLSDAARQDVENTLRAVLADQDAADQWATGRLESALTPPSTFPQTASASDKPAGRKTVAGREPGAEHKTAAGRKAAPPPPKTAPKDELAARRRKRHQEAEQRARAERAQAERAQAEQAHAELARAKEAADAAQRRLRERRAEHAQTDERRRQARDHYDQAHRQVSDLEQQLRRARDELQKTEREHRTAEEHHRTAAQALTEAERTAREAARTLEKLR
ncbi:hypothetical protein [Streptomyces sp. YS-3]|uniref:hypothetical protein n=1 Tax=Streptomyces sp. YS-3 TaxID=3381352 RepID=UPI0038625803